MFVGSNIDQLKVKPGVTYINMEVNQPLSVTQTKIERLQNLQQNSAELQAEQEIQKQMEREAQKQDKLNKFQQKINERASVIEKENKIKKQEELRQKVMNDIINILEQQRLDSNQNELKHNKSNKEEKRQALLTRHKTYGHENDSVYSVPQQSNFSFKADTKKKQTVNTKKVEEENKKKEINTKLSVQFKDNEEIPQEQRKSSKSPNRAKQTQQKISSGYNPYRKHKHEETHAQVIIPDVKPQEQEESDDEIDYDICNFADAEEAVTKYANIRQHLYSLTCNKKY